MKYILREDGSSFHRYIFDYDTGKPLYGATAQGASDDSCWARGQAWGIDVFALNYKDTKNEDDADMIRYKKAAGVVCYKRLIYLYKSKREKERSCA